MMGSKLEAHHRISALVATQTGLPHPLLGLVFDRLLTAEGFSGPPFLPGRHAGEAAMARRGPRTGWQQAASSAARS